MLAIAIVLVKIYVFALFCGLGLNALLIPAPLRRGALFLLLSPVLGLLLLAIIDGYLIAASKNLANSLTYCMVAGVATSFIWFVLDIRKHKGQGNLPLYVRNVLKRITRHAQLERRQILPCLLLCAATSAVLTPVLHAGFPTTPFRNGIDQVGYAETAQYLREGGTLRSARREILAALHTSDQRKAKAHNILALSFNAYVDTEFLLKAMRWSFPGVLASLTLVTDSQHVYQVEFLALFLSYALAVLLVYRILRDQFTLGVWPATCWAAAFALNANILNIVFEGQLAETFAEPYLMLLFICMLQLREQATRDRSEFFRIVSTCGLLVGGLFFVYNEILVLLIAFFGLVVAIDILLRRRTSTLALGAGSAACIIGFIIAVPISLQWVAYTFANLSGLSRAGFWQPHWASLAEILGVTNMYGGAPYLLLSRSLFNELINLVLSIGLAVLAFVFLRRRSNVDSPVWVAAPVLVLAIYLKTKYLDHILNYPYMKLYTLLIPMIMCLFGAAVYWTADSSKNVMFKKSANALLLAAIYFSGVFYIVQYVSQGSYVTRDMLALYQYNGVRRFSQFAVETARYQPLIKDFMLTPLVSLNWVNESDTPKYIAHHMRDQLVVIFWKDDLFFPGRAARSLKNQIVYENGSFLVVRAKKHLSDICPPAAAAFRLDSLSYDPQDAWPAGAADQCDYKFGQRLRQVLNS